MSDETIIAGRKIIGRVVKPTSSLSAIYGSHYSHEGGLRLITSISGLPVFIDDDILTTVTDGQLGIEKQQETRHFYKENETGKSRESMAKVTGSLTVDLSLDSVMPGYDKPYDLLLYASSNLNERVIVCLDIPVGKSSSLFAYERRVSVVTVSTNISNIASSGTREATFKLDGYGSFIHGIILL